MDWFLIILAVTVVLRGMGAGMIYDVALVSLPSRREIGSVPYARYASANFKVGRLTYLVVSITGALLTFGLALGAIVREVSILVTRLTVISSIATIAAFIGTSRALPALLSLNKAQDDDTQLMPILDRFAAWHTFSAVWQVVAFIALTVALAYY